MTGPFCREEHTDSIRLQVEGTLKSYRSISALQSEKTWERFGLLTVSAAVSPEATLHEKSCYSEISF